jgi:hypothetical protein
MRKSIGKNDVYCHSKVTFKELKKIVMLSVECSVILLSPLQETKNLKSKTQKLFKKKNKNGLGIFERQQKI